jgi:hypothetical protein
VFGIWDNDRNDWVRELPSKVDDGGAAILAFEKCRQAQRRAAKHFGCDTYAEARRDGWCEVRRL